ncbi:MAG: hybrid sensor histidine kinase/response regulator [Chromatiaceae bacterium]
MPRILLIDDDKGLAPPLREYFARFDLDLSAAHHPKEGLRMVREQAPDLVILDLMLPDMDGFDVCRAIRRLFRPIETIRAGVARIGAGDLEHRLHIRRRDELGELAHSINAMADDIRDMLEAKRQLLLAISHELRSPLTRTRVNAELLDECAARQAVLADLGELEALLGELLESERLRGRHAVLAREAVDPSELLTELVDGSFGSAHVRLELDPPGTWLPLDPVRIRLLARNLLTNALRHTPPGGTPPVLSSHIDAERWVFAVRDEGPGVAADQLSRLTAPFYRADSSRQRESGGVGLGLYLSCAIAEAHGGTLTTESAPGQGTRVIVSIPVPSNG